MARSVGDALRSINDDVALEFETLARQVDESLAAERVLAMLSGFFGAVALLLAGLGLYGITTYAVARRRAEIGIRMALGAAPADVVKMMLVRVSLLIGAGVLVGSVISLWAAPLVASLLYGLDSRDPATFVMAASMLIAVGTLACWLPAWHASRMAPAAVLRER